MPVFLIDMAIIATIQTVGWMNARGQTTVQARGAAPFPAGPIVSEFCLGYDMSLAWTTVRRKSCRQSDLSLIVYPAAPAIATFCFLCLK